MTEIEILRMALETTEKMWRKERDEKNALLALIGKHFGGCGCQKNERKQVEIRFSTCDQYHD